MCCNNEVDQLMAISSGIEVETRDDAPDLSRIDPLHSSTNHGKRGPSCGD